MTEKKWIMENIQYDVPGSICENCKENGRLYSFVDALDACPEGFGLPSKDEFTALLQYADNNKGIVNTLSEYFGMVSIASGNALKSESAWNGKEKGLDIIGFNAVPTGFYSFTDSVVKRTYETTGYWTSDVSMKGAVRMKIEADEDSVSFGILNRNYGYSVRCIQKDNKYREKIDSTLVKVILSELSQNIKKYIQLQDSFVSTKYRVAYAELKFKPSPMEFWNISGLKVQRNCIELSASLKKNVASCEKESTFRLYAIPYGKNVRYLANPIVSPNQESEFNDGCTWFEIPLTEFSGTSQFTWVLNDGIVWDGDCKDIDSFFEEESPADE